MPRRGHTCRCCGCEPGCPRTHARVLLIGEDYDPPHAGYAADNLQGPECAWRVVDGAAKEWKWKGVPRSADVLATIGIGATQFNESTTRVAMAAIHAALEASNLSDEDKDTFFTRLFIGGFSDNAGRVFDLETTVYPFRAVRDSNGLPQALFELWPDVALREPWAATVDYGCDPDTGDNPRLQVRVSRVFTPEAALARESAVTVERAGGGVDAVSWLLELLDGDGEVLQSATAVMLPGFTGPPWRLVDETPREYFRVSFKMEGEYAHAAVHLATAGSDAFLAWFDAGDSFELLEPATAESYQGAPGARHFFEPVAIADDGGGRGLSTEAATRTRFAGLNQGNPVLSALPADYAEECDPPVGDEDFVQPHVQQTICDRREAGGHFPYGIVGEAFTSLRLTFNKPAAGVIHPVDLFPGEYELDRLTEAGGDLCNAQFWLAAEPGTSATVTWPGYIYEWTATLARVELAASVNVLHGHPCSEANGRTNWRVSVSLAARLLFTGDTVLFPDRSVYWSASWQLRNTAFNASTPHRTGNRADDFLAGLDSATDQVESGYLVVPDFLYRGDYARPLTQSVYMGFDWIKLRLL